MTTMESKDAQPATAVAADSAASGDDVPGGAYLAAGLLALLLFAEGTIALIDLLGVTGLPIGDLSPTSCVIVHSDASPNWPR